MTVFHNLCSVFTQQSAEQSAAVGKSLRIDYLLQPLMTDAVSTDHYVYKMSQSAFQPLIYRCGTIYNSLFKSSIKVLGKMAENMRLHIFKYIIFQRETAF